MPSKSRLFLIKRQRIDLSYLLDFNTFFPYTRFLHISSQ